MLTEVQTLELVWYCKVGVVCLAWLTVVVTMRWLSDMSDRRERAAKPKAWSDDA